MPTQITEVLMGLGSWEIAFKQDAEILGETLGFYQHVVVYEGEEPIFVGVLLKRPTRGRGVSIGGAGVDWWLGLNSDGPVIADREYLSGNNKLSNGDFADAYERWRVDEDTLWDLNGGDASVFLVPNGDEVLESDESFECEPGQLYTSTLTAHRDSGDVGRLRNRLVFDGRFRWPNLLFDSDWVEDPPNPGDAIFDFGDNVLIIGPNTRRQSLRNTGFEFPTADPAFPAENWWDDTAATWFQSVDVGDLGILQGFSVMSLPAFTVTVDPDVPDIRNLRYDDADSAPPDVTLIAVAPGERLELAGFYSPWALDLSTHADGFTCLGVLFYDEDGLNPVNFQTETKGPLDDLVPGWYHASTEITVPDDHVLAGVFITGVNVTVGTWAFDRVTLTHLEMNTAQLHSQTFDVQPGRSYHLLASATSDVEVQQGTLKAQVTLHGLDGRADVIIESSGMQPTGGAEKLLAFDFTAPSGYTTGEMRFIAVDTYSGSWRVPTTRISLQDSDTATSWVDAVSDAEPVGSVALAQDVTVPAGAERVHLNVVAEDQGEGWVVTAADLHRRGTLADAEDIIADALTHPDTSAQLVAAGVIHPAGRITYDYRVRNQTDRQLLQQISRSGIVSPLREWKVTPAGALDWGTPEEIFTDRTELVLRDNDLIIRKPAATVEDASNRLTDVKTIGADRTPVGGQKQLITGSAHTDPAAGELDWFGNPVSRTRVIEDSTIETVGYAAGRAAVELESVDTPAQQVALDLADYATAGRFDVGDTIGIFSPAAGLVDDANEIEREGETIWPVRLRVLERTRKLGAGTFQVFLRGADGVPRDITDFIDWERETAATVKVGQLIPDFATDPQGGAAGVQFRRFRASTGR